MSRTPDAELDQWLRDRGEPIEAGGFHSQDGLIFRRLDEGRVRVSVLRTAPIPDHGREAQPTEVAFTTILPPDSWASVVASVSVTGESHATWSDARRLHTGFPE